MAAKRNEKMRKAVFAYLKDMGPSSPKQISGHKDLQDIKKLYSLLARMHQAGELLKEDGLYARIPFVPEKIVIKRKSSPVREDLAQKNQQVAAALGAHQQQLEQAVLMETIVKVRYANTVKDKTPELQVRFLETAIKAALQASDPKPLLQEALVSYKG